MNLIKWLWKISLMVKGDLYASLIFVLILWWLQRFYHRLRILFYCSIAALILSYTRAVLAFLFFQHYIALLYENVFHWSWWLTIHLFEILSIDTILYGDTFRPVVHVVDNLIQTILLTLVFFAIVTALRYIWKIFQRFKRKSKLSEEAVAGERISINLRQWKESPLKALYCASIFGIKLIAVPAILIASPFVLGRYYFYADEYDAQDFMKKIIVSAAEQTEFYKQHVDKRGIRFLEYYRDELKDKYKMKVYQSPPGPRTYDCVVRFEGGLFMTAMITKNDDNTLHAGYFMGELNPKGPIVK